MAETVLLFLTNQYTIVNFLPFSTFSLSSFSLLFALSLVSLHLHRHSNPFFLIFPSQTITHIYILIILLSISTLYASPLSILFLCLSSLSFSHPSLKSTRFLNQRKGKGFKVKERQIIRKAALSARAVEYTDYTSAERVRPPSPNEATYLPWVAIHKAFGWKPGGWVGAQFKFHTNHVTCNTPLWPLLD